MRDGGTAGLRMDITALKTAESERDYLAYHDALTGLPNQALFHDRLTQALAKVCSSQEVLAVLNLQLVSLTDIRLSQGLAAGKAAIIEAGRRIQATLSGGATVAHVGDGRYLAFSSEAGSDSMAIAAMGSIFPAMTPAFSFNGIVLPLRIVIGASIAPVDGVEPERLIRNATTALNEVERDPSLAYRFYRPRMTKAAVLRWNMESDIRRGIEKNEFLVHYQPQVDARSYRITGAEALIRWAHPEHGLIPPGKFIPVAEETGLIVPLGELALRLACSEARTWSLPGVARYRFPSTFRRCNWPSPP
jgi:predicted signal transduction protein with EAL and GGDEF domain